MIVLADANLEVASSAAVWGGYTNCGQVCLSVERLFVEQTAAEKFIALCVEKTKSCVSGREVTRRPTSARSSGRSTCNA